MTEDELRARLERLEYEEVIDLLIELVVGAPGLVAQAEELLDGHRGWFDDEDDDLAEDDVAYDPGSYETEARGCVEGMTRVWGWSYEPRMAALDTMCEDLGALASSVPVRRRPSEAVNTMMAVLRVVFEHREFQEETELDDVAEHVLMSLREVLTAGHPHRDEVVEELVAHVVEVLSSGSWDVYDGITDILRDQLTGAQVAGLFDQLGDAIDALEPSSNPRRWRLDGVRRFCAALAPGRDLSAHLPEE